MVDINLLRELYFTQDIPVIYKLKNKQEILIYPILVKNFAIFNSNVDILTIEKNNTSDPNIIRMSYLEYVLSLLQCDKKYMYKLLYIVKHCLKEDYISVIEVSGKKCLAITDEQQIVKYYINSSDFEEVRKIILYQNIHDYDDIEVSQDIKKVMDDYYRLTSDGNKVVTLEEKIAFLGNICGLTKKDLLDMTYREFSIRFELAIDQIEYSINKTAEMSGNVKFKKKIEHFIFKKKKDKISQFFVDSDTVKEKIET